ncbi:hypothetical protein SLS60_009955 [Paraconiothyrium brasiliense]|uniref:Zn(2)-C6 fungal-type domain-containing protein n=1 Tax=Paraconiothyrium brasiliense TaxID=300254 RepID=A0ABR3QSY8_9PLEO
MSSQYPPPPGSEEPHYTPIYPAPPSQPSHELLGAAGPQQQPRLQPYPQDIYPKVENLSDVLQLQQQANHALGTDQRPQLGTPTGQGAVAGVSPLSMHDAPMLNHSQDAGAKTNRLRKACDSCSIRKVKCDESGPPCRACAALDIPCTFERPSRRRGPPNRHAEAIKKKRRLDDGEIDPAQPQQVSSPTNAAHALAQLSAPPRPKPTAESICSLPIMNSLIDDFFTYIHPLCPFPHEPSFREAWNNREDCGNDSFLALLASMIAALVASFPRKPRLHLKHQTREFFPSHLALIDRCREICAQARGPGYLDKPSLNVYDACTSYFLGLVGGYTFRWRQLRLYLGECLTILRSLGLHKVKEQGYTHIGQLPEATDSFGPKFEGSREAPLDYITEQIGRRVFYTLFVGVRNLQQLGASFGELTMLPSTPTEQLPPLPLEVDDACIFPHEILPQPPDVVSEITGFNLNVRIYNSFAALSTSEMAYGIDELYDWDQQQRMLDQCLQRCKEVLANIPSVLQIQNKPQDGGLAQRRQPYYPPMPEYVGMRDPNLNNLGNPDSVEARRSMQYEIQKANIYGSHLSTRSYLVEKYFALLDKSNNARTQHALQSSPSAPFTGLDRLVSSSTIEAEELEKRMSEEREQVVKDLLVVLGSIDMVNMEPNGDSFTQKIRSIASTLLEIPKERKGSVALQHQDYLYKFLDILSKLERVNPEGSDPGAGHVDEEAELRAWADVRDYQLKFQEQGGIYGFN